MRFTFIQQSTIRTLNSERVPISRPSVADHSNKSNFALMPFLVDCVVVKRLYYFHPQLSGSSNTGFFVVTEAPSSVTLLLLL